MIPPAISTKVVSAEIIVKRSLNLQSFSYPYKFKYSELTNNNFRYKYRQ